MTFLYIDGINDLHFQNETVRGNMVVLEAQFQTQPNKEPQNGASVDPTLKLITTGTVITSIRGAIQIHAALDELIKKLVADKVIKAPNQSSALLDSKPSGKDKEALN